MKGHLTKMGRIVILCHGYKSHSGSVWFKPMISEIEKMGLKYLAPDFPNSCDPRYPDWRDLLKQVILENYEGNDIYLIAHSMGGYLVLRFLSEFANEPFVKNIKGVLLVAGTATKRPEYKPFYDAEIGWENLRSLPIKWVAMWSKDDGTVGGEHVKLICEQLHEVPGFKYNEYDGFDHFCQRELPHEIVESFKSLLE